VTILVYRHVGGPTASVRAADDGGDDEQVE
jgi:hypothetical protein